MIKITCLVLVASIIYSDQMEVQFDLGPRPKPLSMVPTQPPTVMSSPQDVSPTQAQPLNIGLDVFRKTKDMLQELPQVNISLKHQKILITILL